MGRKKKSKQKHRRWLLIITALVMMAGFLYWYMSLRAPDLPKPPLKVLAASHQVELGMLAIPERLADKPYTQILSSQFSFLTADGPIHWDKARPSATTYNFKDMDRLVNFAQTHHLAVQAHHLVWPEDDSLPKWLKDGNYSKQQLLDIMHDHIRTVVGRYKGKVNEWTVVNEPFTRARHIYDLDNWWGDHLDGNNYIDLAFKWAHEADPQAKLILNDFYNEIETDVSNDMYAYLKAAKARGVPIDGIGMQMHIDASQSPDKAQMIRNMQRFGALGYPVYITEFDISSAAVKGGADYKTQLETRIVNDVARACIESKSCVSFNVFGMTDRENLLKRIVFKKSRSYLFTSRYQPKASFYSFRGAWLQP